MGRFEKNRGVKYVGGEIHVVKCIDPDRWSYFEALGIVKEFKYGGEVRLWWKGSSESLYNNLRLLNDDREALNLAKYADDNEEEVELNTQKNIPAAAATEAGCSNFAQARGQRPRRRERRSSSLAGTSRQRATTITTNSTPQVIGSQASSTAPTGQPT
ncbi:hypothetical protein DEO72_LG3g2205 [Vigna unguiculata]|uniref:PB1-like domain-containing protein n=1 Tax=Vigna unguiculata TaxID=3917 RepID=A0A4D6LH02_VIGUN|nr:hypothetical protein DEO72_LG3g2205 [Vigna unguiculata]